MKNMTKEQTPITAGELSPFHEIFEHNLRAINDNKNRNDLIIVWFRQSMEQYAQYREKKALERFIDWCDTEEKNYKSKEELIKDFLKHK